MKTIHRFSFTPVERFTVRLPIGSEIIRVAVFGSQPCMWAECEIDGPREERVFYTVTDDRQLDPGAVHYLATIELGGTALHIFSAR